MRKFRFPIHLLTAVIALFMASCSSDDTTPDNPDPVNPGDKKVQVQLNIGVESPVISGVTRAWNDANATDGEMMKNWLIVAVNSDNTIDRVIESTSYTGEREYDQSPVELTPDAEGTTHTFYSFANISKADIATAMGFTSADQLAAGATVDVANDANWTYNVDGNKNSASDFTDGIPMSNKQQKRVVENQAVNLEVVRMVAKINVTITNKSTDQAIYVPNFAIHNITSYQAGNANLKLLPGTINSTTSKRNINLNGTPSKVVSSFNGQIPGMAYSYYNNDAIQPGASKTLTAYVNESEASPDDYFLLSLYTADNQTTYRDMASYAFSDENESDDLWKTIARNEVHNLNITIDKYKVKIDVTAFTAIGVTPSVHDDDTLAVIDLGMYGEFHLTPVITNRATGATLDNNNLQNPQIILDATATNTFPSGKAPFIWWNRIAQPQLFGLSVGNYTGEAIYDFTATINDNGTTQSVSKRIKIRNTAINFSDLAKRRKYIEQKTTK